LKQHKLLLYELASRRRRGLLLVLAIIAFAIAVYDQFNPLLHDDLWYVIWIVWAFVAALWFYYAVLMRRGAIRVLPKHLRLQGPLYGANISYGRIHSSTSARMEQHHHFDTLKGGEQSLLKPLYQQPCLFIELSSYPPSFKWRRFWFPRFLFGSSRPGLICAVEDWMNLSQDIEVARGHRQEKFRPRRGGDSRSLASRILEEKIEFD
jgi:hypothetical protein